MQYTTASNYSKTCIKYCTPYKLTIPLATTKASMYSSIHNTSCI